jgi:ABC-type antimicrobial peptide transport system permease subunit
MVPALVGVAIGIPLGVAAGRLLWNAFARTIFVVPEPSVPALAVLVVAVASLALAAVVAVLPGLAASRIPIAEALRAE